MNACTNYSCKLYGCVGGCRRVKRKGDDMSIRDWFGGAEQQQRNAFEDTAPGQIAVQHGPRDRPEFEEAMKVLKARAVGMEKELQAQVPEAVRASAPTRPSRRRPPGRGNGFLSTEAGPVRPRTS